jgi:hypothetical protein
VCLAPSERVRFEATEVGDVLGDERPLLGDGCGEDVLVLFALEMVVFGVMDGDDVVAARTELLRDRWRVTSRREGASLRNSEALRESGVATVGGW